MFYLFTICRYPADTNLVFIINKNYWLAYHYLAPWDYQTGEYGKYGTDNTSAFIRVCAALGLATNLRVCDGTTVKKALYMSLDTEKSISECLAAVESQANIPNDHYLDAKKYI